MNIDENKKQTDYETGNGNNLEIAVKAKQEAEQYYSALFSSWD